MKEVTVHNQKDFNKIKDSFTGKILIENTTEFISINRCFNDAYIYVSGNATIESVYGNATIKSVYDNATIESVYGNATIKSVSDNATIEYVSDNATIKYVSGNATILLITMFATICALYGAKKILAKGNVIIRSFSQTVAIEKTKSVTVIYQEDKIFSDTPSFKDYAKFFPVDMVGSKKVILYKTVHKKSDGVFFADYDKKFIYETGKTYQIENALQGYGAYSYGLHVSYKQWAINFGNHWDDVALIECEVDIKDIVVASDCDGKVRTSKLTVIREVPKTEW